MSYLLRAASTTLEAKQFGRSYDSLQGRVSDREAELESIRAERDDLRRQLERLTAASTNIRSLPSTSRKNAPYSSDVRSDVTPLCGDGPNGGCSDVADRGYRYGGRIGSDVRCRDHSPNLSHLLRYLRER